MYEVDDVINFENVYLSYYFSDILVYRTRMY